MTKRFLSSLGTVILLLVIAALQIGILQSVQMVVGYSLSPQPSSSHQQFGPQENSSEAESGCCPKAGTPMGFCVLSGQCVLHTAEVAASSHRPVAPLPITELTSPEGTNLLLHVRPPILSV